MTSNEIPQWVSQSFVRATQSAGATAPKEEILAACEAMLTHWCAPNRMHHGFQHLVDMLSRVDTLAPEMHNPDLVRLASWGHGLVFSTSDLAVYTRNGGEDEVASAKIAREIYTSIGIPAKNVETIGELIEGMRHQHENPLMPRTDETAVIEFGDMDKLALCDAHLGILAVEPQKYKRYLSEIRTEYDHISPAHFDSTRKKIVKRLLDRKHLFCSPLGRQWEAVARQNLAAELERLEAATTAASAEAPDEPEEFSEEESETTTTAQLQAFSEEEEIVEELVDNGEVPPTPPAVENHRSSLEEIDEIFDPGPAPRVLVGEEAEAARREEIAEEAFERIEEKQRNAAAKRAEQAERGEAGT